MFLVEAMPNIRPYNHCLLITRSGHRELKVMTFVVSRDTRHFPLLLRVRRCLSD